MFNSRRRHRHSVLQLILALFGIHCLCNKHKEMDDASREELRHKATQFRSKLKDAFSVWWEPNPEAPQAAPEAPAAEQG